MTNKELIERAEAALLTQDKGQLDDYSLDDLASIIRDLLEALRPDIEAAAYQQANPDGNGLLDTVLAVLDKLLSRPESDAISRADLITLENHIKLNRGL